MGSEHAQEDLRASSKAAIPSALVHELRTPLTAIHGYAQLLDRRANDPTAVHRAADIMLRESTRLAGMLAEMSQVAELDYGPIVVSPIDLDIVAVVQDAVRRAPCDPRRHEVVVVGERELHRRADPRRLLQILSHLLGNAIHFSPDGGCVLVQVTNRPTVVQISIGDEGIGIPDEEQARVYERYFRGSRAKRLGIRGLGLGLYIANDVARHAGGRVWHEPSPRGAGTVFHLELPTDNSVREAPATGEVARS